MLGIIAFALSIGDIFGGLVLILHLKWLGLIFGGILVLKGIISIASGLTTGLPFDIFGWADLITGAYLIAMAMGVMLPYSTEVGIAELVKGGIMALLTIPYQSI